MLVVAIMVATAPGHRSLLLLRVCCHTRFSYPEKQNWQGNTPFPPDLRADAATCARDVATMASMHNQLTARGPGEIPDMVAMMKFSVLCSFAQLVEQGSDNYVYNGQCVISYMPP